MAEHLGIVCKCSKVTVLEETLEEQVERLFKKANEQEKEIVVDILGPDYWFGGHVHDKRLVEDLFQAIIQVLGNALLANGKVRRMVEEGIYIEVMRAMDGIVSNLKDGCMLGYFYLQAKGKKKKMQKAWSIFKACIVKEYNMDRFVAFLQENVDLFLEGVGDRLVVIENTCYSEDSKCRPIGISLNVIASQNSGKSLN
ncbi:hypothetical protein SUGI_0642160 [Cryptomeria japonica]|nr:hypothetical protein SUGI_0642160 [Cryptomeria japonica]